MRNKIMIGACALGMILGGALLALAAVGTPPYGPGAPALIDQVWLRGIAGGVNYSYQANIAATGTTQATSVQLPAERYLMQVDTTPASSGAALPPCLQGTQTFVFNNGANALTVYPSIANNPTTNAQDTINGTTSTSVASKAQGVFSCAKNGVWGAK